MTELTIDRMIDAFLKLRDAKERIDNEYKNNIASIKDKQLKIEVWLQQKMQVDGVDSYRTSVGTAFKTTTEHASVADWDALLDFVKTKQAWHLLEKRVSKTAVRGYLEEEQPLPPGVNWYTKNEVQVRKPSRE